MSRILDIAPLRSFVAVADCGGFQRAAAALYLSQGAISQHVRRLETAIGRPLVERQGRGSRFTGDGEILLRQARRILAVHDETLCEFGVEPEQTLVIGSTEHAAAQLLPELAGALTDTFPDWRVRFRIDRGAQLRSVLADGRIDVALLLGPADHPDAQVVGELELTWYSAPAWQPPRRREPIPLVAFDAPCALRTRALDTLAAHRLTAEVACEAAHLAGVQAAVQAGLGVGLMATLGQTPQGLVARDDLPAAQPLALSVWSRRGLRSELAAGTADALRRLLARTDAGSAAPVLALQGA
ncbi:DNA-binding transcriptional LysR family regulator [Allocatelliglobosispora scoriae]|uniref:DNA-binding transcriptional LysR family regulator n=1 Tax=Allocatelliglobosispora scoriae TaxID=643052 RepID=A0A841BH27_9ACTN|nr:LysR substrate-binding domain-containing protein [Allocatelliglobosispora scoriae]MBB5866935.1 DNA-binding transcriptional LysR family regulator [Allocatelliglobosispora scoriae]